jgi:RNA recognition motif-containing protein
MNSANNQDKNRGENQTEAPSKDVSPPVEKSDFELLAETFSDELSIFVNNIDPKIPEDKLRRIFGSFGRVTKFILTTEKFKRSFAFIQYEHPDEVTKAFNKGLYQKMGRYEVIVIVKENQVNLKPEGKLFIRGIHDSVTSRDLHEYFGQISNNLYISILTDEEGKSRNSGYAHFYDPLDAEKAFEAFQYKEFKGSKLELQRWIPKDMRERKAPQNLYIANLPDLPKETLESKFRHIFEKYGDTNGIIFNDLKPVAMVMYKDPRDAQKAFDNINKQEGCADLSVTWLKSALERREEDKKIKNKLYIDGLKINVSKDTLMREFEQFGEITSLDVKPKTIINGKKKTHIQYAVIAYRTEEEAERALATAHRIKDITRLFLTQQNVTIKYFGRPVQKNLEPSYGPPPGEKGFLQKNMKFPPGMKSGSLSKRDSERDLEPLLPPNLQPGSQSPAHNEPQFPPLQPQFDPTLLSQLEPQLQVPPQFDPALLSQLEPSLQSPFNSQHDSNHQSPFNAQFEPKFPPQLQPQFDPQFEPKFPPQLQPQFPTQFDPQILAQIESHLQALHFSPWGNQFPQNLQQQQPPMMNMNLPPHVQPQHFMQSPPQFMPMNNLPPGFYPETGNYNMPMMPSWPQNGFGGEEFIGGGETGQPQANAEPNFDFNTVDLSWLDDTKTAQNNVPKNVEVRQERPVEKPNTGALSQEDLLKQTLGLGHLIGKN